MVWLHSDRLWGLWNFLGLFCRRFWLFFIFGIWVCINKLWGLSHFLWLFYCRFLFLFILGLLVIILGYFTSGSCSPSSSVSESSESVSTNFGDFLELSLCHPLLFHAAYRRIPYLSGAIIVCIYPWRIFFDLPPPSWQNTAILSSIYSRHFSSFSLRKKWHPLLGAFEATLCLSLRLPFWLLLHLFLFLPFHLSSCTFCVGW